MSGGLGVNEISSLERVGESNKVRVKMITDAVVNGKKYLRELALI